MRASFGGVLVHSSCTCSSGIEQAHVSDQLRHGRESRSYIAPPQPHRLRTTPLSVVSGATGARMPSAGPPPPARSLCADKAVVMDPLGIQAGAAMVRLLVVTAASVTLVACAAAEREVTANWTPYPWKYATTLDTEGRKLNIAVFDFNRCRSAARESDTHIRVSVLCAPDSKCEEPCGLNVVAVRTRRPIADRQIIDASTGEPHTLCAAPTLSLNENTGKCEGGLGGSGPH